MEKSHFYVTHTHTHTHTHIYTGFFCLPEFQSHNTLHLLLLRVNFIQLQRKSNNFHRLTFKTQKDFEIESGPNTSTSNYDVCIAERYKNLVIRKFHVSETTY